MKLSTKVRRLERPIGNLVAWVDVIVDDKLSIGGFKIVENKNGSFFLGVPSTKGKPDANGESKWFDNVMFLDREPPGEDGRLMPSPMFKELESMALAEFGKSTKMKMPGSNSTAAPKTQSKLLWEE